MIYGMESPWRCTASTAISERVRALLGHQRIDTTQIYASIRPTQLKRSVEFLEAKASRMLEVSSDNRASS
jgi:hypothetical protein